MRPVDGFDFDEAIEATRHLAYDTFCLAADIAICQRLATVAEKGLLPGSETVIYVTVKPHRCGVHVHRLCPRDIELHSHWTVSPPRRQSASHVNGSDSFLVSEHVTVEAPWYALATIKGRLNADWNQQSQRLAEHFRAQVTA